MNQFAAFDFYGWAQSSGSCEFYFDDLMIEEAEWSMPVLPAPSNLEAEVSGSDVHLTWDSPAGDMTMLSQHDNMMASGYFQEYGYGYGVVFDLSSYTSSTLEMIDFRHSSWGNMGMWDYQIHIVNWDTYTDIATVGPIQTTVNDDWELSVDLGSVAGTSGLVGIFIEPLSNDPMDAYPVVDFDVALDGSSVYGDLANYPAFFASDGDFLINLWITGSGDKKLLKAETFNVNGNGPAAARTSIVSFEGTQLTANQSAKGISELQSYNVYRDGQVIANTADEMYDDLGLPAGQYEYYVTAVYDLGESDPSNTVLVDVITSITSNPEDRVRVYPNPFDDLIHVESHLPIRTVDVLNVSGQVVQKVKPMSGAIITIDVNDLKSGVYYLRMETDNGHISKKVIKK
jgi:hypothetical protein